MKAFFKKYIFNILFIILYSITAYRLFNWFINSIPKILLNESYLDVFKYLLLNTSTGLNIFLESLIVLLAILFIFDGKIYQK